MLSGEHVHALFLYIIMGGHQGDLFSRLNGIKQPTNQIYLNGTLVQNDNIEVLKIDWKKKILITLKII